MVYHSSEISKSSFSHKRGFLILIKSVNEFTIPDHEKCGSQTNPVIITPQSTELLSYGFDGSNYYLPFIDCYYMIELDDDFTVEGRIEEFDVEFSAYCMFDSVQIWKSSSPGDQQKYCGRLSHNSLLFSSEGANVYIRFLSDKSGHNMGFRIKLDFKLINSHESSHEISTSLVDDDSKESRKSRSTKITEKACDKSRRGILTLKSNKGTLKSPKYPKNYPNNSFCILTIKPKKKNQDGVYRVDAKYINVEYESECMKDYIALMDPNDDNGFENINFWCGSKANYPFFTTGPELTIIFRSDSNISKNGFKIAYKFYKRKSYSNSQFDLPPKARHPIAICKHDELNEDIGYLEHGRFMFYEEDYNKPDCSIVVSSRNKKNFRITMQYMNIDDESPNCTKSYIEISDSEGVLETLCGKIIPNYKIMTRSSWFKVRIVTDGDEWKDGFRLHYRAINSCPKKNYGRCANRCVHRRYICDGKYECINGEDEMHCQNDDDDNAIAHDNSIMRCGDPHVDNRHERIVGGSVAQRHTWPWQAALYLNGRLVCGGSIIDDSWILTAGHCVHDSPDASSWIVILGEYDMEKKESHEQRRYVKSIHLHPNYDAQTVNYDIALMRLKKNVEFNEYVRPICIPDSSIRIPPENTRCFVTGWGDTENTGSRSKLREVDVKIISRDTCSMADYYGDWITDMMFCAGHSQGGKDACQGDSGGPLVCFDSINEIWMQHGVVSWGLGCADAQKPGVYSKINAMRDWVDETIKSG